MLTENMTSPLLTEGDIETGRNVLDLAVRGLRERLVRAEALVAELTRVIETLEGSPIRINPARLDLPAAILRPRVVPAAAPAPIDAEDAA
jgi:hypothetical protein